MDDASLSVLARFPAPRLSRRALVAALAALGVGWTPIAEAAAQDVGDAAVPMFQGNPARTGEMPGPGPQGEVVELWRFSTDDYSIHDGVLASSPAVVDGIVYIGGGDGNLYALDAGTGRDRWSTTLGAFNLSSAPAVVDGTVYVGSEDNHFYALDAATGQAHWSFDAGGDVPSAPTVANGIVYVGSRDEKNRPYGNLYALDAATGQGLWSIHTDAYVCSSPAVLDGVVYIGFGVFASMQGQIATGNSVVLAIGGTGTGDPGPFGKLVEGGVASLTADTIVRGAPSAGSVELTRLTAGVLVTLITYAEVEGERWWRVETAAGIEGWLPATVLEPTGVDHEFETSAPEADQEESQLEALLPTEASLPVQGLVLTNSGDRTLEAVAGTFGSAEAEAAQFLSRTGWTANVFSDFVADPDTMALDATIVMTVNIHQFANREAAGEALIYFSNMVLKFQRSFSEVRADSIGDMIRVLRGVSEDGTTNVVAYVADGPLLFRVGGSSPAGDPTEDVLQLADTLINGR